MQGNQTILNPPDPASLPPTARQPDREPKTFAFDKSYWSACPKEEEGYASQQTLYEDLGVELLNHAFDGFNTTIFACAVLCCLRLSPCSHARSYGQTGSGERPARLLNDGFWLNTAHRQELFDDGLRQRQGHCTSIRLLSAVYPVSSRCTDPAHLLCPLRPDRRTADRRAFVHGRSLLLGDLPGVLLPPT